MDTALTLTLNTASSTENNWIQINEKEKRYIKRFIILKEVWETVSVVGGMSEGNLPVSVVLQDINGLLYPQSPLSMVCTEAQT